MGAARRFAGPRYTTDELEQIVLVTLWRISARPEPRYVRHYLVTCVRNYLRDQIRSGRKSVRATPLGDLIDAENQVGYRDPGPDRLAQRDELEFHLSRATRPRIGRDRPESFPRRKIRLELRRPIARAHKWM